MPAPPPPRRAHRAPGVSATTRVSAKTPTSRFVTHGLNKSPMPLRRHPVKNLVRKTLSKGEEGHAYAYGGGGLTLLIIIVVIVLLLR